MNLFFTIFSAAAIASALLVVTRADPVESVLSLVVCFFSLACLFVLLDAHFLAAAQVLVYAGAILVLFTFVIMLLDLRASDITGPSRNRAGALLGAASAIGILAVLANSVIRANLPAFPEPTADYGTIEAMARVLTVDFVLPFAASSVLLLVATIGAVWIARQEDS